MPSRVSCKGCKHKHHHTAMKDTYPWYGYDGFVTGFDLTNEDFDGTTSLTFPTADALRAQFSFCSWNRAWFPVYPEPLWLPVGIGELYVRPRIRIFGPLPESDQHTQHLGKHYTYSPPMKGARKYVAQQLEPSYDDLDLAGQLRCPFRWYWLHLDRRSLHLQG